MFLYPNNVYDIWTLPPLKALSALWICILSLVNYSGLVMNPAKLPAIEVVRMFSESVGFLGSIQNTFFNF
jgi:hypothetical protein